MRQQNGVNSVEVADELPETGLRVRPPVHQQSEAVDSEKGTVAAASGEHIAAGAGELEKPHSIGRRQEIKGRQRGKGAGDEGGELLQSLHGGKHLRGIDVQRESPLHKLGSQERLPPVANVGTAESQTEFG